MEYTLESASIDNLDLLIQYKLNSIFDYTKELSNEEIVKIDNFVKNNVPKQLNDYKIIKYNNEIIGCVAVGKYLDGVILDELYIESKYRNNKIGTKIIKNILANNKIVYLYVYKNNVKAIKLYQKLGFLIVEEIKERYFMKYSRLLRAREFCSKVKELSEVYDLPFFLVTDGASAINNNGCEAIRNARENQKKWELQHGFNPNEDWGKNT